ncbi:MAG: 50S ribosomal protein L4 [Candidatus Colwellbacteria bacterium]|nr:50S ribosomal protein L4 [Candidatus Colwellbacteria bacterium]
MKSDLYNQEGQKIGTAELPGRVFGVAWNADLVHQALRVQAANVRQPLAHVKGRGDVRGGGRKPWRQKGTGRARHGSIRSPLWKGGGVTHGPNKDRVFSLKINRKMRQKALFSVLSRRLKENEVRIIESAEISEPKTKLLQKWLKVFSPKENALIIVRNENKYIFKAASNLSKVTVTDARALNVYDLLRPAVILIDYPAVEEIDNHYHASRQ